MRRSLILLTLSCALVLAACQSPNPDRQVEVVAAQPAGSAKTTPLTKAQSEALLNGEGNSETALEHTPLESGTTAATLLSPESLPAQNTQAAPLPGQENLAAAALNEALPSLSGTNAAQDNSGTAALLFPQALPDPAAAPDTPSSPLIEQAPAETTLPEASVLPDYASSSGKKSCRPALGQSALKNAAAQTEELCARLNLDQGEIYVAPTVVPDEFRDCIGNLAGAVLSGLKTSGKFTAVQIKSDGIMQNQGSGRLIPQLVRLCRSSGVPYLNVTVVHKVGGNPVLTMRFIRVNDGVTLTQSFKKL